MITCTELGSGTRSAIVRTGLVVSEVETTVFERLIYTCNSLCTIFFLDIQK